MRTFGDALSARDVCDCAKAGDPLAVKTIDTSMYYLGRALATISMVADPEIYVIGGGVSRAGQYLIDLVKKHYADYTPILTKKADIVLATLGNDAGIYGSAKLVLTN